MTTPFFRSDRRLEFLMGELLSQLKESGWRLEAWAVFSNHYHFVAHAQPDSVSLSEILTQLHRTSALRVNELDAAAGRRVWCNYWDTQLTYETSYLARLNYVHQNAVKHGLVTVASHYPWCSAAWFERTATLAQVRTIYSFKTDKVRIHDDYTPV